ncbi:WD40 repeat-like protein [Coniophora puteana RWD-64-598 SS2]|uniref:WD40 repeat-like protein n=1 Tax=Coniophora puteana (strain RWD-64-598) TaxID=741705 RepID=A0A5M3MCJ4_CONPW|nr:WD40 repeat-like protein [Coniophora puteana RWD-64-598 SS2]EIW76928.1 WD40 repeat-like protein [Coniophora puteana RWD-64-598 SS2]
MNTPSSVASLASGDSDTCDRRSKAIHAIAYSPDGDYVATGHRNGVIRLWETQTLQQYGEDLRGHSDEVLSIAYSPDGRRLVSGSYNGTIRVWDTERHTEVLQLHAEADASVWSVAYSPDGSLIGSGGIHGLKLWDATTGECIAAIPSHGTTSGSINLYITFSPDGSHLATVSRDHLIRVINVEERRLAFKPIAGHKAGIRCVAYSPDGSLLASASDDHTLRIWDATSGKLRKGPLKGHKLAVSSVAFSADGQRVLSTSADGTVCIWDISTGKVVVGPLFGHSPEVTATFSPDGKRFVIGDHDGTVRMWDAATGKVQFPPLSKEDISHFRDRELEALRGMNAFGLVDAVAWFPDGQHFVTTGRFNVIRVWDVKTGEESSDPFFGHVGRVTAISISNGGELVASGSQDTTVRLWSPQTAGETRASPLKGHSGPVSDVMFTTDSARLVACSRTGEIRIWDTNTGENISLVDGIISTFGSVGISADGRMLAGGSLHGDVSVWDLDSLKLIAGPFPHDSRVIHVSFSRDGTHVFTGTRRKRARTWDVARGEQVQLATEVHYASNTLKMMDYNSDRTLFLSVGDDKSVWVWDATDVKSVVGALVHEVEVDHARFSPDGKKVLTACVDGSLRIWDVATGSVILPRDDSDNSKDGNSNDGSRDGEDDSIMNMPATVKSPAQRSSAAQRFFDHDGDEVPSSKRKRSPTNPRTKLEIASKPLAKCRGFFRKLTAWNLVVFADLMADLSAQEPELVTRTGTEPEAEVSIPSISQDAELVGELKPFSGHTYGIRAIAYSPDGMYIATGSGDSTIRIWDRNTGNQVGETVTEHTGKVNAISYSPDQRFLVSGSDDHTVRFWDLEHGYKQVGEPIEADTSDVLSVQYSPDGKVVASAGSGNTVKLWSTLTHELIMELGELPGGVKYSVSWAPNGKRLAVSASSNDPISIFDLEKRKFTMHPIIGHKDTVNTVAFSPNGTLLASGSDDRSVRIWNAKTGKAYKCPFRGHRSYVLGIVWSPDGKRLVVGSGEDHTCVWDVHKGQIIFRIPSRADRESDWIWAVAYSPDGKHFARADDHRNSPEVQVWDANTGRLVHPSRSNEEERKCQRQDRDALNIVEYYKAGKMRTEGTIMAVAWFADGQRFASAGGDGGAKIWDAETGSQVGEPVKGQKAVNAVSVSADGRILATASDDATINLFDVESRELIVGPLTGHTDAVLSLRLVPDGSRIVSGGKDGTIRFWDGATGKMVHTLEAHKGPVCALSISQDETKLASGSEDNTVFVWDWQTYDLLGGPFHHGSCVRAVCFSPDDTRLLSGSDDGVARVWNVASGNLALDPINIHSGSIGAVDWSSDGSRLLTTGTHDWTICVWDAATGKRIHEPLEGHDAGVKAAAFSSDCKLILSGSMDGTLCVWDVETGDILLDKTEPDVQEDSDGPSQSPGDPQEGTSANKRARRQPSDDSFMEMPATIARKNKQGHQARNFWDDVDTGGGQGTKIKKAAKQRPKKGLLKSLWPSPRNGSASKQNTKRKGKNVAGVSAEGHAMRRMRRTEGKDVIPARDKLRVLASGDNPHARRSSQEEPESDGGSDSTTDPDDPNQPHIDSSSDDESVHGLIDTLHSQKVQMIRHAGGSEEEEDGNALANKK